MRKSRQAKWIWIALIACVAIALRLYAIDRLPPGLFGDEAVEGLDALDVLAGNLGIWFHAHLGREPMYVYLVALSYRLFGVTSLATRLPAIIAGLLTIPAAFFCIREIALVMFADARARATRIALLAAGLLAISFWHLQMTRDAHRDTLLPLVECIGYFLLWRGIRTQNWRWYAGAGAVLGLAIYTYSPGRFVSVFVTAFVVVELIIQRLTANRRLQSPKRSGAGPQTSVVEGQPDKAVVGGRLSVVGLGAAVFCAILVMLPLGIYFAREPSQFSRRFNSVSVLDFPSPALALASSVTGNLAQFVVPGAGYQSKHYNLPGKPIFDLLIAPWFLAGVVIALTRLKQPVYRFVLLWFAVMMTPAFLTADMIPKAVRVFGIVPGVFVFPALAMEWLLEVSSQNSEFRNRISDFRFRNSQFAIRGLLALCFVGSALWTTYDYFVAWANLPEVPLAFDADMAEVSEFILRQPVDQPIVISQEVYRPPTLMLLGERVPTTQYVNRATRIKEANAHTTLVANPTAVYVFVRDYILPEDWFPRLAPQAQEISRGQYYVAFQLGAFAPPQKTQDVSFNPWLKLVGVSCFTEDPRGIGLYWQVMQLPNDRTDLQGMLSVRTASGVMVAQGKQKFGVPPLEWAVGDTIVEWYVLDDLPDDAAQISIEWTRAANMWKSPAIHLR